MNNLEFVGPFCCWNPPKRSLFQFEVTGSFKLTWYIKAFKCYPFPCKLDLVIFTSKTWELKGEKKKKSDRFNWNNRTELLMVCNFNLYCAFYFPGHYVQACWRSYRNRYHKGFQQGRHQVRWVAQALVCLPGSEGMFGLLDAISWNQSLLKPCTAAFVLFQSPVNTNRECLFLLL